MIRTASVSLAALLAGASPALAQSQGTLNLVGPSTTPGAAAITSVVQLNAPINAAMAAKADYSSLTTETARATAAEALKMPLTGGTLTNATLAGTMPGSPVFTGSPSYGSNTAAALLNFNGPSNATRGVNLYSAGVQAWSVAARSNSTNDLAMARFNPSTGALVDVPFVLASATGILTLDQVTTDATVTWVPNSVPALGLYINNRFQTSSTQGGADVYFNAIVANDL